MLAFDKDLDNTENGGFLSFFKTELQKTTEKMAVKSPLVHH